MSWAFQSPRAVADALLFASIPFWGATLICYVLLTIRFFRRGAKGLGLLCSLCLLLGGGGVVLGIPVSLVFGWMHARRWVIVKLMIVYTSLFAVAMWVTLAAFVVVCVSPAQWS